MSARLGELLAAATTRLDAAIGHGEHLPAPAVAQVAAEMARAAGMLARLAGGFAWHGEIDPAAVHLHSVPVRSGARAALALREAEASLRLSADHLAAGSAGDPKTHRSRRWAAARELAGAADALAAGHDLLQTHFAPGPDGSRIGRSRWAPLIASPQFGAALLGEVAACARRLSPWAAQLAQPRSRIHLPPTARVGLGAASQWLKTAAAAATATAAHGRLLVVAGGQLLAAVPAHTSAPARRPPLGGYPLPALLAGTASCAERLRHLTPAASGIAGTGASWQRTAHAAAIITNTTEPILRTLATRATQLGLNPDLATGLNRAAHATGHAWAAWRAAARHWDTIATGTSPTLTPVAAEMGDLVLWIGRIGHHNPHWTPAAAHASPLRDGTTLAPAPAAIPNILAAVHDATDTIAGIGAGDREAIRAAAADNRLYVPTRLLPARYDIPRPFTLAPAETIDALLATYDTAITITTHAVATLDQLAIATAAPTSVLAALHAAAERGTPHLLHPPTPAAGPAHSALAPAPGQMERILRGLDITETGLLDRAAALDHATHDLLTEATAKTTRRDSTTDCHLPTNGSQPRPHPARLAAKDTPTGATRPTNGTAGQSATSAAVPAKAKPARTPPR